jgi:hypothetical protein
MKNMKVGLLALALPGLLHAAPDSEAKSRPRQALAQVMTLLEKIREAGTDETPLDQQRVEALFGVRTVPDCSDFDSPQGHQFSCRYVPARPQRGVIRFAGYLTARLGPGPMQGGNVTWELDPLRLCLRQDDLVRAFGVKPERARHPVFPDFFAGSRYVETRSYDFTLLKLSPEANYVAVHEVAGCVQTLTLSNHYRSDW